MSRGHATRSWLVVLLAPYFLRGLCASNLLTVLVHHPEWDVPRILSRCNNWAKSHGSCSVEFEEEADIVRAFHRTWDMKIFKRVCVATLDCYSSDPHQEISALGQLVDALGPDVSVASISGGSTVSCKPFASVWVVGTVKSYLTTHSLIFACLNAVYSGKLLVCSVVWLGSQWSKSSSTI